ncbi:MULTISPECIES: formate dehydrogenase accessory sulfurtransferase FdhD [Mammaliicoccus]|uniref:Sulfur carrier protein FdhD n=2 Tax=Mammaliicoccus fleurettii TaxID=150056 RepID=A0ABS5MKZ2_9STAP|nr:MULTISPECIES: formate dehydrogenase accessory sulfurtransferase FdhD [Mammaliicoccus]HCN61757.1 formate dehydrogenase accessory sulfurtransferase FdhD [Staphylococcus sp.]MBL0846387.1 formate dehydrogenase accessory sulfurtransferase FdhD [Mammaliicoccus fleurettii]MBS3671463.1 formate dehydrogenase accessory sulfurtransferase FdhD [Mammaliicoccus fleurettii]MBS3696583.1 formate dehydrogenase accessory sulfurtransferase FdhD [Mammaliicoccus fleurettii]MBW0764972.1 formate dehydrogenase acce
MKNNMTYNQPILKFKNNKFIDTTDCYVSEFPLTIMINGEEFATIICSPNNLRELVIGFIASEGVIIKKDEIKQILIDDSKGFAHVELTKEINPDNKKYTQRMISSCCGKSRAFYFNNDAVTAKVSQSNLTISPEQVINMMDKLHTESKIFKETGGLHNAAISDGHYFYEHRSDIGRHNALDKLFGYCIEHDIPIRNKVLIFSGRISSEILIKAAKIGVGIILSKSAPTSLAINLAEDLNITAVGFIRDDSFNVYSHSERINTDNQD